MLLKLEYGYFLERERRKNCRATVVVVADASVQIEKYNNKKGLKSITGERERERERSGIESVCFRFISSTLSYIFLT